MTIFYNIAIIIYQLIISLLAPFNIKAGLWYRGRKNFFMKWKDFDKGDKRVVWIHCASLGEFEQGRPVIEEIKKRDSRVFVLLTFFSPSGLEVRKNYPLADAVCYLPADTPGNARKFIKIFRPDMAVYVKYEFWYNYLDQLHKNEIPLYLISAIFRPDQIFFKWYGKWFKEMLHRFTYIFVQNEESRRLLNSAGVEKVTVAGDTRFDRVFEIAQGRKENSVAAAFSAGSFTIVAGSTWPPDHELLAWYLNNTRDRVKLIIAPHEIHGKELNLLENRFNKKVIRYSGSAAADPATAHVLLIDNIGMLSSLYPYGDLAYIGGGFGKGIHNILEACTHGMPVIFGPQHIKFMEALELADLGGAFPVKTSREFSSIMNELTFDKNKLDNAGRIAGNYVKARIGATSLIADRILNF